MNDRLYINEKEVDLSPDTVIALTFQINDLAELKDRQANFSNQFKIPKTKRNRLILGNADMVQSPTNKPYRKLPVRLFKDGLEVVTSGYAIIQSSDTFYNVTVYSGNTAFFDDLEKKLSEFDFSAFDHDFTFGNALGSNGATAGNNEYKYSIIDYGDFSNANRNVNMENQRPLLFMADILNVIIDQKGFTAGGDILEDANFKKVLVTLFNGDEESPYYDNLKVANFYDWGLDPPSTPPFPGVASLLVRDQESWTYNVRLVFRIDTWTNGVSRFKIHLVLPNNSNPYNYVHTDLQGTGEFDITFSATVFNAFGGVDVLATLEPDVVSCTFKFHFGEIEGTLSPNTEPDFFLHIKRNPTTTANAFGLTGVVGIDADIDLIPEIGEPIDISRHLPNMTKGEFLQSFAQMFGILFYTDPVTNTIYLRQFKEILDAIPVSKDWSDKLHWEKNKHKTEYRIGSYAQVNNCKYKEDENDEDITLEKGNGSFSIDDETLEEEKDAFVLSFAATRMERTLEDLNVPLIRRIEDGEFTRKVVPRVLIDDVQNITGNDIIYYQGATTANVNTNVPLCYFQQAWKTFNLGFDDTLLQDNYSELIDILSKSKKLTLLFNLSASDISSLDHFIPVYLSQFGAYFYINKIINWTGRGMTKVELIRIQSANESEIEFAGFSENYELQEDLGLSMEEDDVTISGRADGN